MTALSSEYSWLAENRLWEQTHKGVNRSNNQSSFKLESSSYQKSKALVGITSEKMQLYLEGICQYFYNTQLPEERQALLGRRGSMSFYISMTIGQTVRWSKLVSAQFPTSLFVATSQNPMEWTEGLTILIHSGNLLKNTVSCSIIKDKSLAHLPSRHC